MKRPPPSNETVEAAFPGITNASLFDTGGFKAVYSVEILGRKEALELVEIPELNDPHEADIFRAEVTSRVRREVEALRICKVAEIVKLGTVPFQRVQLNGAEFLAYSEEFLDGKDLWNILIAAPALPGEKELRRLSIALLNAIRELWGHGYVHRDIKPKNVMKLKAPNREFVLLDLGIA